MPVSFNSPPRNFFLLGSGAQQALTNFFDTINRAGSDRFNASDIAYSDVDQKYILAGSGKDSNTVSFGWLEKQAYDADTDPLNPTNVEDWRHVFVDPLTSSPTGTTLNFMKQTASYGGDIIIGGKTNNVPWIAEYSSSGAQQWVSSSQSGDVEYFGVACTSTGYYACGHKTGVGIDAVGFAEKFDSNGMPQWGKSAFHVNGSVKYNAIAANDRGEVVVVGSVTDQAYIQGYVAKLNAYTGEVLWDKTINSGRSPSLGFKHDVEVNNIYIDGNDQIYVVGTEFADIVPTYKKGFIIKYSAEGNLIWHKTTPANENHDFLDLWSDTPVEQTVVLSRETFQSTSNSNLSLIKYSKNGDVVFRRRIITDTAIVQPTAGLDGDPSFYYMLFVEEADDVAAATSKNYTFGKVSASGNGFGAFTYETHHLGREIEYRVNSNTPSNPIGRLADGSVRNDSSDFISYPYSGLNLLLGDDLATNVAYKKTRHKEKDLFEYSGSPAQRVVDFTKLNIGSETKTVTTTTGGQVQGQQAYTTAGSYTWTAPANVTSVCVVCVGAGGGGGGALAYKNNITVVPGTGYAVEVGSPGVSSGAGNAFSEGGDSSFTATLATIARGGKGTSSGSNNQGTPGGDYDGGGSGGGSYLNGGYNGGGAGGYSGDGGTAIIGGAGTSNAITQGAGSGGAGGGGAWAYYPGGGVGILGEGANGTGGVTNGTGGSGGQDGQGEGSNGANSQTGGNYGGGGSGRWSGNTGGKGAVRIIWGSGREFPSTNTADVTPSSGPTTTTTTTIVDQSGNGFDGTIQGATQDANGHWQFDGVDDFIMVDDPQQELQFVDTGSDFAIECWAKRTAAGSGSFETMLSTWGQNSGVDGWIVAHDAGSLHFTWAPHSQATTFMTGGTLSLNTWYHIMVTRNGNAFTLYLNGVSVATGTNSSTIATAYDKLEIGHYGNNANSWFTGNIGEVRIYPKTLTAAEVNQNYNATKIKYENAASSVGVRLSHDIINNSTLETYFDFNNKACWDDSENWLTNSYLNASDWGTTNATKQANAAMAPDGTKTATLVTEEDVTGFHFISSAAFPSGARTFSVYCKAGTTNRVTLFITQGGNNGARFNLETGQVITVFGTGNTAAIEDCGGGWYRCSIANDGVAATIDNQLRIGTFNGATNSETPASPLRSIYVWGPQVERRLESPPLAGRYLPRYSITKTREALIRNLAGTSNNALRAGGQGELITNRGGYLVFDGVDDYLSLSGSGISLTETNGWTVEGWFKFPDPTNNNSSGTWNYLFRDSLAGGPQYEVGMYSTNNTFEIKDNGTAQQTISCTITPNTWHFICMGQNNVGKLFLKNSNADGSFTTVTSTSAATSGDCQIDKLFSSQQGGNNLNAHCGEIRIYNREIITPEFTVNYNATRSRYGV